MSLPGHEVEDEAVPGDFARAVIEGLSQPDKRIPCRFLYDARGSELFEDITRLDEYYPTRTEIGLLEEYGSEIARLAGEGCAVVEFGSGSSRKTHILLEHMNEPAAYVPIDIDVVALEEASERLRKQFPGLPVHPVHADFDHDIELPDAIRTAPKLGFFPGSTIGNFELDAAIRFLARAGDLLSAGSALLVGADLRKDPDVLHRAYDDPKGVTADFTLNLLYRINRELGGDFDVAMFEHMAVYNAEIGRVEIYIKSLADQAVAIAGRTFAIAKGERIHVENSHKYTIPQFHGMARKAGWRAAQAWTDGKDYFSLHYLVRDIRDAG